MVGLVRFFFDVFVFFYVIVLFFILFFFGLKFFVCFDCGLSFGWKKNFVMY